MQWEATGPRAPSFCEGSPLINHCDCGVRAGIRVNSLLEADDHPGQGPQRADSVFSLSLCCVQSTGVSWKGALHAPSALVLTSSALVLRLPPRGCRLLAALGGQVGLHFWVPQEYGNGRDSSCQATITRLLHRQLTKTCSSVRDTFLLVTELQPEQQASGVGHI